MNIDSSYFDISNLLAYAPNKENSEIGQMIIWSKRNENESFWKLNFEWDRNKIICSRKKIRIYWGCDNHTLLRKHGHGPNTKSG